VVESFEIGENLETVGVRGSAKAFPTQTKLQKIPPKSTLP